MIELDTFPCITNESLASVTGGAGDAGQCFDQVASWGGAGVVGGAIAGAAGANPLSVGLGAVGGGVAGAGGAYLSTPACGDGTRSPMQMMRESATSSGRGNTSFDYQGAQTP